MSDVAARFRTFQIEAPHWVALLAQVPARHILRHDTTHPAFHGCIDWHSACHATWALLAYRGLTGARAYDAIVDAILMPAKLAEEAADLARARNSRCRMAARGFFALRSRIVWSRGSTRCGPMARAVADSLRCALSRCGAGSTGPRICQCGLGAHSLLDYAAIENRRDLLSFVVDSVHRHFLPALQRLPGEDEETAWPDFMAVTPMICEIAVRSGAMDAAAVMERAGLRLLALKPVVQPLRPHHHALNFSRAWALFGAL